MRHPHGIRSIAYTLILCIFLSCFSVTGLAADPAGTKTIQQESDLTSDTSVGQYAGCPVFFVHIPADVGRVNFKINGWVYFNAGGEFDESIRQEGATPYVQRADDSYYNIPKSDFENAKSYFSFITTSNNADYLLFQLYDLNNEDDVSGYIVLEWEAAASVNTAELEKLLQDVPNTEKSDDGYTDTQYYHIGDKYNGKQDYKVLMGVLSASLTSKNIDGFWDIYVDVYADAKNALTSTSQERIDSAYRALTMAYQNLIPISKVNPTLLYEELLNEPNKSDYTPKSWSAYTEVRDRAEAMMATMFDKDGKPTAANTSAGGKQEALETLAAELTTAREALDKRASITNPYAAKHAGVVADAIEELHTRYANADLSAYTDESVQALRNELTAAEAVVNETPAYSAIGLNELGRLQAALRKLRIAALGLETKQQEKIQVKLSVLDPSDIYNGKVGDSQALRNPNTRTATLTLPANASAYELLCTRQENGQLYNKSNNANAESLLFLKGELLYPVSFGQGYNPGDETLKAIKLHDGDELSMIWFTPSLILNSSTVGTHPQEMLEIVDWFRYSTIQVEQEVTAGVPFTVTVTSESAFPFLKDGGKPFAGAEIYYGAAKEDAADAETTYVHRQTNTLTDENGQAQITLYEEGYVLLNAFRMDTEGRYTVGPSVLVHVNAATDPTAAKLRLREQLDEVYYDENYPESAFTAERWAARKKAYEDGVQGIANAATLAEASTAQSEAIAKIKELQSAMDETNVNNPWNFRYDLSTLPDDVTKLDKAAEPTIKGLIARYEKIKATPYQLAELTDQEIQKYEAVVAAYEAGLPKAKEHTLTFEQKLVTDDPDDQKSLKAMIAYLQANTPTDDKYGDSTGNKKLLPLFGFSKYGLPIETATALTKDLRATLNPDYTAYLLCRDNGGTISGDNWSISDAAVGFSYLEGDTKVTLTGSMTYTINGKQYAIRDVSIEGAEVPLSLTNSNVLNYMNGTLIDASTYKGKRNDIINVHAKNAQIGFIMPFNDVKIVVTWGPVGGTSSEAEKARADALTALETVMKGYEGNTKYADKLDKIREAYETGIAKIKDETQTPTVDAINRVRRETASKMAKEAAGSSSLADYKKYWGVNGQYTSEFDPGSPSGSVTLIIEDTTYDDSKDNDGTPFFYTGPTTAADYSVKNAYVYKENYIIGDNDTMMTVILRALKEKGCTWTGTGGAGFGITYLSGIKDSDHTLSEFTGGNESGWMGTLNGFFVNLSFSEFRVTPQENQNSNILLADGDVIHVMYTCTGLGEDLGGTFYNSDTTLKALKVMDGDKTLVLAPEFESVAQPGGTYSYTVMIDGDAAELTITTDAANKNYLVKRFLNEKVTDNTEGGSYYKSTQAIPVVSGDTIYIGCGEPVWPSMNNQSTEARDYVGTWYELHIVSTNSGGSDVDAQIDALPNPNDLTYTNRETYRQDIVQAKQALDALKDSSSVNAGRKQKLEALCDKLAGFDAVDAVKKAIADLPTVSNATLADKGDIDEAKAKYDALTDELRTYLKASEKQKLADLLKRIEELNQEALTRLVVSPDTVSAVVDAKTGTIRLVGYVTAGKQITLNDIPVANGDSFTLGYSTYRIDMSGVIEKAPNVELEEKRPEIKMPEDAGDDVKQAVNTITSPSTTSDGLKEAAAETLTETAKKLADEAAANAEEGQTVEVTAEVNLKIEVTSYNVSDGKNELVLEIKPQVTYTTVVKNADGTTASSKTTDAEDLGNHVINAPVTISLALPTGMSQENLYVKHQISEDRYEYIKPTIEKNVATWQQSSFSVVILTSDRRTAMIEMDGVNETLTPEDIGKELPTVSMPNKDFLGWTFVIDGAEYPGGPYTELTDELLTALSKADGVSATPVFKDHPIIPVTPVTPGKPSQKPDTGKNLPFTDVSANNWFYDGVKYAYENGLMNGTSSNAFSPNANTTRGMIVTILARVEGVNTNGTPWYAAGQKWAMDNGISDGTNMPGVITREQLATILYRYAKQKGYDVSKSTALTGFSDADKVSGYASEAMQWAVAEGLLQGSNGKLNPQGSATRAQVATILMRFMEKIAK